MHNKEIEFLFESFEERQIVIIGDVMIDSYMWGVVDRISPEAPVPIIASTKRENRLGGAANVAMNVKSLGGDAILCSVVGSDDHAKTLTDLLDTRCMTNEGIVFDAERMTTIKTRIISNNQHLIRVDQEKTTPLSAKTEVEFVERIKSILESRKIDAIIFEDYDKGVITPYVIDNITQIASRLHIPTLVDPKKRNFNNYHDVTIFKPNFKELKEGLKLEIDKGDFSALASASAVLHERNIEMVFVTLSEHGVFMSYGGSSYSIPAEIRDIADVSGAGDTVVSVAAMCLALGVDAKNIAVIANLAGGLVCEKVGVVPIDKDLLKSECFRYFSVE